MNHVMIDIETLAQTPDAHILSVAARAFNPRRGTVDREGFSLCVGEAGQEGRNISRGTVGWWLRQSEEARKEAFKGMLSLPEVLGKLSEYMGRFQLQGVWACGPSFDLVILAHAYREAGRKQPWFISQERDVRTLRSLVPPLVERATVTHFAHEDVLRQIDEVNRAFYLLGMSSRG